jgi:hypothetical protein
MFLYSCLSSTFPRLSVALHTEHGPCWEYKKKKKLIKQIRSPQKEGVFSWDVKLWVGVKKQLSTLSLPHYTSLSCFEYMQIAVHMLPDDVRSICRADPSPLGLYPHTHIAWRRLPEPATTTDNAFATLTAFGFVFLGPSYMHTQRGAPFSPLNYYFPFLSSNCSFQEILRSESEPTACYAAASALSGSQVSYKRTRHRNGFSTRTRKL